MPTFCASHRSIGYRLVGGGSMKREEDMKRFSVLVCCLSIGLAVFCRPTPANAQSAVIGGCGFVLSSDCTSPDKTSLAKSVKISLNAAGVWTSDCSGTTTTTPTTATKCDGETLNANSTEVSPADPCSMALAPQSLRFPHLHGPPLLISFSGGHAYQLPQL